MLKKISLSAVAMALASASAPASASMIAAVCQDLTCSTSPIIVGDNQAGDTIPGVGAINFSVAAFGYSLVVNTSQSKPVIGSAGLPQLDLNFTATGTGTIFLYVGDTDFTLDPGQFLLSLAETSSGTGPNSVTGRAWGGSTNNALTFSPLLGSIPLSGTAASGMLSGTYDPSVGPYSLSLGVQISRESAGTTTGDLNFQTAVPEPATWAMMLIGFGAIGFTMRRQKKGAPIAAAA